MDKVIEKETAPLLQKARRTVMEHDFLMGLILSLKSPLEAVMALNKAIGMLSAADLQSTSIHTGLWTLSASVLRGETLQ